MRVSAPLAVLGLAACGAPADLPAAGNGAGAAMPIPPAAGNAQQAGAPQWRLDSTAAAVTLALLPPAGAPALRLICPSRTGRLLVNAPAFRPIGSEERMSFGSGGAVVALVADPQGDAQRGGVTATGPAPANLPALLGGPVSVSYGAQTSGPHPAPPAELVRTFAAACTQISAIAAPAPAPAAPPAAGTAASPCLVQGSARLANPPLRAVGTEPFWGARIEGRCVTYSTPEDQAGTRVWTRYTPGAGGGGTWSGALGNRRFELVIRPEPGCSDGMSDRRYPLRAELIVHGERRTGCAAPS